MQRRSHLLAPYRLKCDKESLNPRLGPPDFYLQTSNCPEETLTREYVQSGYKETFDGLEESREVSMSEVETFTKRVVAKCKEVIKRCHRTINESRVQKRKAGQIYGVPLSGLLLDKPGAFPEQRPCGEDFIKRWIEGLSHPRKRLRSLAECVPHGHRRKSLIDVLVQNKVPLLRASWFVKVTYLNQVRPSLSTSTSVASDRARSSRTELWTKDIVDYLQHLLDEFLSRNNSRPALHGRDRSQPALCVGLAAVTDAEEPALLVKWNYITALLHWHLAEGLLVPSLIIDWFLALLLEKDSIFEVLQLLLPVVYAFLEILVLSQSYVRALVTVSVRLLGPSFSNGSLPVDNSISSYLTCAVLKMLQYLILAVPDSFVALDCFPFPPTVLRPTVNNGCPLLRAPDEETKKHVCSSTSSSSSSSSSSSPSPSPSACLLQSLELCSRYESLSLEVVALSIQMHAERLEKAASPCYPVHNAARLLWALDKSLQLGDVREPYDLLFGNFSGGAFMKGWVEEVSLCLRSSLKWIANVSLSFICSVFFLCEWATCGFWSFRSEHPHGVKFTGGKDYTQIYIVGKILRLKMRELGGSSSLLEKEKSRVPKFARVLGVCHQEGNGHKDGTFQSLGPLHDVIVCWLDQHDVHRAEDFKCLQILIAELVRSGIFSPQAYVRQLVISGVADGSGGSAELVRCKRHYHILKQLSGLFGADVFGGVAINEALKFSKAMHAYSKERRNVLSGLLPEQTKLANHPSMVKKVGSRCSDHQWLKASISLLLQLPTQLASSDSGTGESQLSVSKVVSESIHGRAELLEASFACEDCSNKAKKQKLSEERSSYCVQGHSPLSDDEYAWWVCRSAKSVDCGRLDPLVKSSKLVSRGRQKVVRRTQSLAQLATSRIEGSQGASTSHVCDSKLACPHQRMRTERETPKVVNGMRKLSGIGSDISSVVNALKKLPSVEKKKIAAWLMALVRQLVDETEKSAPSKACQLVAHFVAADSTAVRWRLGDEELSVILYLMDVSNEFLSAAKLLLWLWPKVASNINPTIYNGRNVMVLARNVENHACEVGESFLLSSLRRYERMFVAADLITDVLSTAMQRIMAIFSSNGRLSNCVTFIYFRYLYNKYCHMPCVSEWEKSFKATCDRRFLSELEAVNLLDGDLSSAAMAAVQTGLSDDDLVRQKLNGNHLSRMGMTMRDVVQRLLDDAFHYFSSKERKPFGASQPANAARLGRSYDEYQTAQQIIVGLLECIRQASGAAQEGDPSLVSFAVSAIVHTAGPVLAKIPDFTAGGVSLGLARCMLRVQTNCLCLLREALGERQNRVFEVALAAEASSALSAALSIGKGSRSQFQLSPEAHNPAASTAAEPPKSVLGRGAKCAAAVSALILGAVIHGAVSLERMVTVLRLKEGLDVIQFVRNLKMNPGGGARPMGALKPDNLVEVSVLWFRLLVGNFKTVLDGLVADLLGKPSIVAISRLQRTLPLGSVLPPAYSIFAFVIWRPFILSSTTAGREDIHVLYQSMTMAVGDIVKHLPFRDLCLRDTRSFYDLVAVDATDSDFASMLELNGLGIHLNSMAFLPLRARLFLDAVIDCRLPGPMLTQEDGKWVSGYYGSRNQVGDIRRKLADTMVILLDSLQLARFGWQSVELRLLMKEQALIDRLEANDATLAAAVRAASRFSENGDTSENDRLFVEAVLTRILVRPDAASLFSELVRQFGRGAEDSLLTQAKWFLAGHDVLFGRKSVKERLANMAESKGLSTKGRFLKPWGWCMASFDSVTSRGENSELTCLEEGEVVEESSEPSGGTVLGGCGQLFDSEDLRVGPHHLTETAFLELLLPCLDQASKESCSNFALELIKQLNSIEQQACANKQAGAPCSGLESPANKVESRKGLRGLGPGLAKKTGSMELALPTTTPSALRASISLRFQLLVRLFPVIYGDREPSGRNMRYALASVILRLLGHRMVYADAEAELSSTPWPWPEPTKDEDVQVASYVFGKCLFDKLLAVLHGLLSICQPSWLKTSSSLLKSTNNDYLKVPVGLDRDVLERLQNDLDHMLLPGKIRWRIQSAMPILFPNFRSPVPAVPSLHPRAEGLGFCSKSPILRTPVPVPPTPLARNALVGKLKQVHPQQQQQQQENELEADPWALLEDGTAAVQSSSNATVTGSNDHANVRASSWLKGAIRVRREDLTYIGAVDDDT